MATADKAKELQLINKLEFRIALEKNDEKLQSMLNVYMVPLLLKLKSPHAEVQQKVVEVCQHVTTRLETSDIQLPVLALLEQLKLHGDSRLLRLLNARYTRLGISRISDPEILERVLIDGILKDISKHLLDETDGSANGDSTGDAMVIERNPSPAGPFLLHFLFQLLLNYKIPRRGDKRNETYRDFLGLQERDGHALSKWFAKLLLLSNKDAMAVAPPTWLPGLTQQDIEFLTLPEFSQVWQPNTQFGLSLTNVKSKILDFAETGGLTESERQWVFLFATRDTNSAAVSERGDGYFKSGGAKLYDQKDEIAIRKLYEIYIDSNRTSSHSLTMRTRILQLLTGLKPALSAEHTTSMEKVFTAGIETTDQSLPVRRFNSAFLAFCTWVFRSRGFASSGSVIPNQAAQKLIQEMKDYLIQNQGWPTPDVAVDNDLRGKLYQVIGVAAQEGNIRDINLLKFLFQSLNEDKSTKDVLLYVEDALSSMTITYSKFPLAQNDQDELEQYLINCMDVPNQHKSHLFRLTRFANRCLPYRSDAARYINVIVSGSKNFEAAEEGRNGLNPYLYKLENINRPDLWSDSEDISMTAGVVDSSFSYPSFQRIVSRFFSDSSNDDLMDPKNGANLDTRLKTLSESNSTSFRNMIKYSYRIFATQVLGAENPVTIDAKWEASTDLLATTDAERISIMKGNLQSESWTESQKLRSIIALLRASLQTFNMDQSTETESCQNIFVNILTVLSSQYYKAINGSISIQTVLDALPKSNTTSRDLAARGLGILFSITEDQSKSDILTTLISWAEDFGSTSARNRASGAIIALSHALARVNTTNKALVNSFPATKLNELLLSLLSNSSDRTLLDAVYTAIGLLSIWQVYGDLLDVSNAGDSGGLNPLEVVEKIHSRAKSGDERAIAALGRFSVWTNDDELLRKVYEYSYGYHDLRQTEAQFTVGEAICCVAYGLGNTALDIEFDIARPAKEPIARDDLVQEILDKTLLGCKQSKPSLRRASLIWLLSLVRFSGDNQIIATQLDKCHQAFKASLGHRDELVQEAAARGLGIVYERASKDLKDTLVKDLLSSFSTRQTNLAGMVSADTELFQEGTVSTGATDGSVSTYKQILDLANEAGNPSLVYQFMSLAADNEVWTSRSAFGKFGLSNIFADSNVESFLAENPKLLPALYRYQFDPSTAVQDYMKTLWKALIKDPAATLDANYDHLMKSQLKTLGEMRWRDIEASYLAIIDLISGRKFEKYEPFIEEIWEKTVKGLDHIKGSVRVAAGKLAKVLTNTLVRTVESDSGTKEAQAMSGHIIPFLLSQTAASANPESKEFAAGTIIKLCKKSRGHAIEQFVPELIAALIKLFTDMEPDVVNWMHLNASKLKMSTKDIDEIRLNSGVKNSPLMEAIEKLIDNNYQNPSTIENIVKVVDSAARTSVGMPSLAATSRILVVMMVRYHARYKTYTDSFFKSIRKPLFDRNDAVCSSFAYASGYLARHASEKGLLDFIEWVWTHWRDNTSDRDRGVAAEVFYAMAKYAPERCSEFAGTILPFVFVGKHDSQEDVMETFKSAWGESTGGQRAILLHLGSFS